MAEGQRSLAVLVGSKQLARIHGDDAMGRVTEVLLSPECDGSVAAHARHTLDALDLGPVVEARSGGQGLVVASAQTPGQARVAVIWKIGQDCGGGSWRGDNRVSGRAVAPAARVGFGEIERTAGSRPGVHVGAVEAEPAP